jgi:hypothetical protein
MRENVLSELDVEILNILNSDVHDDIKAMSYVSALTRFKHYSAMPKPEESQISPPPANTIPTPSASPPSPPPPHATPAAVSTVSFPTETRSPPKRSRKRSRLRDRTTNNTANDDEEEIWATVGRI